MSVLLNMDPGAPPVVVTASEGDVGRIFTFQLIKDGMPASYPSATVTAEILKSDGHGTTIPCTWSGSEVMMVTTEQSTIRAGKANCELRISQGNMNIGTANFILAVEPRPINADTDQTDSSYSQTGEAGDVWTLGSNGVPSWSPSGLDASTATAGQVLTADGNGGHYWGDVQGGSSSSGVSTSVKQSIVNLLSHAIYQDFNATTDLAVLEAWVNEVTMTGLSAVYTQSGTVYNTDSLSDLTADLVVTASYDDGSTSVISSSDYVLSGTLSAGSSTITVSYGGFTDTFTVTVTEVVSYSVTNNLTNITNSNSVSAVAENGSYSATLTPDSGYRIDTVTVTMGGTDVTSNVYSNGTITINSVSGDIVITATGTQAQTITISYTTDDAGDFSYKASNSVTAAYSDEGTTDITSSFAGGTLCLYQTNAVESNASMSVDITTVANVFRNTYVGSYDLTNKIVYNAVLVHASPTNAGNYSVSVNVLAGQRLALFNWSGIAQIGSVTATYEG